MNFVPHEYQKVAIEKTIDQPAVGLLLEMGLGKTVSVLTAIQALLYDYFDVSKVLVIAPLRVAQSTWSGEIEKWDHLRGLRLSKVLGNEKQRIEALNQPADLYIINRENTEWLVNYYGRNGRLTWLLLTSFPVSKTRSQSGFGHFGKSGHS